MNDDLVDIDSRSPEVFKTADEVKLLKSPSKSVNDYGHNRTMSSLKPKNFEEAVHDSSISKNLLRYSFELE
jgi:hypothetical protein